ncbi:creatininase family protein [Cellulosilyticum ruminicola]|uniref:creatininase family protein n=1 Tax=Cellulosilyticum ruminicola TaxID=425254 RepID=UPI0006D1C8C4|nr:creatininase family protein [Cellulosilyticum ruminicola]
MSNILKNTMVEMTWPEIDALAKKDALVILPLGVIEEHSRHLPLGTDIYIATKEAEQIAEELTRLGMPCVIAPPFYWGAMEVVTKNFPGSFNMRAQTIKLMIEDILMNLETAGFKKVIAINAHGDEAHRRPIVETFKAYNVTHELKARWQVYEEDLEWQGFKGDEAYIFVTKTYPFEKLFEIKTDLKDNFDIHAGAFETAEMKDYFPELTNMEIAKTLKATNLQEEGIKRWLSGKVENTQVIPDGHAGDPANSQFIKVHLEECNKVLAKELYDFYNKAYIE